MIHMSGMTDADSLSTVPSTESHLRRLLADEYDAVVVVSEEGRLAFVSDSVHSILGYPPQYLLNTDVGAVLHPDERASLFDALVAISSVETRRRAARVARLRHCNGSWVEMELMGVRSPIDLGDDASVGSKGGAIVGLRALTDRRVPDRVIAADDVLFRRLATISGDLTVIVDASFQPVYVSPSITSMLGRSVESVQGLAIEDLFSHTDRDAVIRVLREANDRPGVASRLEVRARSFDDGARWVDLTVVNLLDDMMVRGIVLHARDIHDRRCIEEELRFRAHHDPLTGLPNRYCFVEMLTASPARDQLDRSTAVIFCDLDRFKSINDQHGHLAGDEVLRETARRLRTAVRPDDLIARIGGDEFCVVCEGLTNVREALEIAERIRSAVVAPTSVGGSELVVGVSIGVAWSDGPPSDGETLLRVADRAMYVAKTSGRNKVELAAA